MASALLKGAYPHWIWRFSIQKKNRLTPTVIQLKLDTTETVFSKDAEKRELIADTPTKFGDTEGEWLDFTETARP